jgi:hypothetical protein
VPLDVTFLATAAVSEPVDENKPETVTVQAIPTVADLSNLLLAVPIAEIITEPVEEPVAAPLAGLITLIDAPTTEGKFWRFLVLFYSRLISNRTLIFILHRFVKFLLI